WIDDAYLLAGESYYAKDRYDDAIRNLQGLRDSFPKSPLVPEALTFLGAAYVAAGDLGRGREVMASVLQTYPKFKYRDLTNFLLAESYRSEKRYGDALPYYETIVTRIRGSSVWDEAALEAGLC